jgi:hypothetical protein
MFVVIAGMESAVHRVIEKEMTMINQAPTRPAFPTTQPKRRYMMTPKMVSRVGVKTPPKVPNFVIFVFGLSINFNGLFLSFNLLILCL